MRDELTVTRAGFGPRAAAFVVDRLLVWLALLFVRLPAAIAGLFGGGGFASRAVLFQYSALDVICFLLSAAYFVLMTYYTGGTLGKKLMRLRVERSDGGPVRFIDILYRETAGRFLSGILFLGYLMVLADKENRAFHDWLCGTCVVYSDVKFRRKQTGADTAAAYLPAAAEYSVPGQAVAASEEGSEKEG